MIRSAAGPLASPTSPVVTAAIWSSPVWSGRLSSAAICAWSAAPAPRPCAATGRPTPRRRRARRRRSGRRGPPAGGVTGAEDQRALAAHGRHRAEVPQVEVLAAVRVVGDEPVLAAADEGQVPVAADVGDVGVGDPVDERHPGDPGVRPHLGGAARPTAPGRRRRTPSARVERHLGEVVEEGGLAGGEVGGGGVDRGEPAGAVAGEQRRATGRAARTSIASIRARSGSVRTGAATVPVPDDEVGAGRGRRRRGRRSDASDRRRGPATATGAHDEPPSDSAAGRRAAWAPSAGGAWTTSSVPGATAPAAQPARAVPSSPG